MNVHEILRATPDLSPSEKLILSILASHSGRKGACWPAQGTIAREAGLSRKTVWTALKRLESGGLVKSEARKRPDGGETSKVYRICEVSAPPLCNGYTPPCEIVTHPPVKLLHTLKRKKVKTKKEETTTSLPQAVSRPPQPPPSPAEKLCVKAQGAPATSSKPSQMAAPAEKRFVEKQGTPATSSKSGPRTTPAEKLCVEREDTGPVVNGDGQHQAIPEIPGLSTATAEGLAKKHGIARLLEVASLSKDKRNPAGWVRSALEGGWLTTPPAAAVDTKKNEEYKQLMTLWEALPETERRRAYLRGGGFGSPEMPNPSWLKKFFHSQTGKQAI